MPRASTPKAAFVADPYLDPADALFATMVRQALIGLTTGGLDEATEACVPGRLQGTQAL